MFSAALALFSAVAAAAENDTRTERFRCTARFRRVIRSCPPPNANFSDSGFEKPIDIGNMTIRDVLSGEEWVECVLEKHMNVNKCMRFISLLLSQFKRIYGRHWL
jgi:hypothetical protein